MERNPHTIALILFIGYTLIIYTRQSVSFAAPVIAESEKLQISDLGFIMSSQMMGYLVVKFIGGAVADLIDPGVTYAVCLIAAGIISIAFTACSSVMAFATLWFLCGVAQGPSWASIAVLVKKNFPSNQLGKWWSILSVSSNVAGTGGPFLSQALVKGYGWRSSLYLAGTSSMGLGLIAAFYFYSPRKPLSSGDKNSSQAVSKKWDFKALFNPLLLVICVLYLLTSIIRGASCDWGQLYLIHSKGQSLFVGSSFISCQEFGGIIGSVMAGFISDYFISKMPGQKGIRLMIISVFSIIHTVGLAFFVFTVSDQSAHIWINVVSFLLGFGVYGSITLLGIASMEAGPENLAGTSQSMATLGGNIGRVLAGYPLSLMATWFSWHESFLVALLVSTASICVAFITVHLSRQHYRAQSKAKDS